MKLLYRIEYVVGAALVLLAAAAIAAGLNPAPDDHHQGAYAIVGGLFLVPFAVAFVGTAEFSRRQPQLAKRAHAALSVALLVAGFALVLAGPI